MAPESPRSGIDISPARERLLQHEHIVADELMQRGMREWGNSSMEQRDAHLDRTYGHGRLEWLKAFQKQAAEILNDTTDPRTGEVLEPGVQSIITAALDSRDVDASTRIENICEALTTPPPSYGEEPDSTSHPYLTYKTVDRINTHSEDSEPLSIYHVNEKALKADIAFLEDMERSFPGEIHAPTREAIQTLINQLRSYMLNDQKAAALAYTEESMPKSYMDLAGKKLGRIALTGVLAGGTLLFGTIAAVNYVRGLMTNGKAELSVTPFLWAFATWFVADPGLLKSFFGSTYDAEFAEIRNVTSSTSLKQLCGRYDIGGERWKSVVEGIYEDDPSIQAVLASYNPTNEAVAEAAQALSGRDIEVAATLTRMMRARDNGASITHFGQLVNALRGATRDEAKEFMTTYIERDCVREGLRHDETAGAALHE